MAFALVAKTSAASSDGLAVTTGSIDTTGAGFLAIFVVTGSGTQPLPTDSKSNTWTALTLENVPGGEAGCWYYTLTPIVGSGHTFSWSTDFLGGTGNRPSIFVLAFSVTSPSFDQQTGTSTFPGPLQPGTQTPSQDNCLVLQGLAFNTAGTIAINESYNFAGDATDYQNLTGNALGGASAYKIQTTATATNPSWSDTASSSMACRSASFKAAGGATVHPWWTYAGPMMGSLSGSSNV